MKVFVVKSVILSIATHKLVYLILETVKSKLKEKICVRNAKLATTFMITKTVSKKGFFMIKKTKVKNLFPV